MGTINALGKTVPETWANLQAGVSGVGPITLFDTERVLVKIACEISGFDPGEYMDAREARRRDRFAQLASVAAAEAIGQSGLEITDANADRIAVVVSTAVGGLESMQEGIRVMDAQSPRRISPFLIPMFMPNGASGMIAIDYGAKGPCLSIASACASAADSLGQAALMIRSGMVDVCVAGGSEATVTEIGIGSFDRLGALSRRAEEPYNVPRPFDQDRDGLVMGEGAAVMVIESADHAHGRGADILGELAGYGSTADAFHVTAPLETGVGGAAAIQQALADARTPVDAVDYINAHGTATELNDVSETRAIKAAFGEHAYDVAISSTKSMTGHMMGATGALEAIVCLLAIRDGVIPPTINLDTPDPDCDLDYVPREARAAQVEVALSNAFGFGGHNAVLVFKAYSS
jgi:beta-ketoacyl-acyl-carrier-protein synthase II